MKKWGWIEWLIVFVGTESIMIYKMSVRTGGARDYYLMVFLVIIIVFIPILYQKVKK